MEIFPNTFTDTGALDSILNCRSCQKSLLISWEELYVEGHNLGGQNKMPMIWWLLVDFEYKNNRGLTQTLLVLGILELRKVGGVSGCPGTSGKGWDERKGEEERRRYNGCKASWQFAITNFQTPIKTNTTTNAHIKFQLLFEVRLLILKSRRNKTL